MAFIFGQCVANYNAAYCSMIVCWVEGEARLWAQLTYGRALLRILSVRPGSCGSKSVRGLTIQDSADDDLTHPFTDDAEATL